MEAHTENLALFYSIPHDTSIERIDFIDYKSIAALGSGTSLLEFQVNAQASNSYISLKHSKIHLRCKITHNAPPSKKISFGPVNNFANSLLHNVELALNQQSISPESSSHYAYKSFIDTLFNQGHIKKNKYELQLQMFDMDDSDPRRINNPNTDLTKLFNGGLVNRTQFVKDGEEFDVETPIYLDFCQQDRLLLNGVEISIKAWLAKPQFALMASDDKVDFKITVTDATLRLCTVKVSPGVIIGHNEALKKEPAIYYYNRSVIKCYNLAEKQQNATIDQLFNELPQEVIVALLPSANYNGGYDKNPFFFPNLGLSYLSFLCDGVSCPGRPFQPRYHINQYDKSRYMREYSSIFTGKDSDSLIDISKEDYYNAFAFYKFTLSTPEKDVIPLRKRINARIDLAFTNPLNQSVVVMVYAKFHDSLKIDASRSIILQ